MADKNIPTASQSMSRLVDIMHQTAKAELPCGNMVGIVLAPPPDIQVQVNTITLTAKECYISDYLLSGYTRHYVGQTSDRGGGSGDAAYESHNHPIDNDLVWTDTLKPGDLVSIEPIYGQDEQLYLIKDRVIKL